MGDASAHHFCRIGIGDRQRRRFALGVLLAVHLCCIIMIKSALGEEPALLWLSHVCLGLAAAGLLIRSPLLVSAAALGVIFPHGLWLFDAGFLFARGGSPLGMTLYLRDGGMLTWAATAHHLYLLPLLAHLILRRGWWDRRALPVITALFIILVVMSRVLLAPSANVNYAWRAFPGADIALLDIVGRLSPAMHVLAVAAFMFIFAFAPAAWMAELINSRKQAQTGANRRKQVHRKCNRGRMKKACGTDCSAGLECSAERSSDALFDSVSMRPTRRAAREGRRR